MSNICLATRIATVPETIAACLTPTYPRHIAADRGLTVFSFGEFPRPAVQAEEQDDRSPAHFYFHLRPTHAIS